MAPLQPFLDPGREQHALRWESPVGPILLLSDGRALTGLYIGAEHRNAPATAAGTPTDELLERARAELARYFAGEDVVFSIPLAPRGTAFQRDVWRALLTIPRGETRSYHDVAEAIGRPRAVRAVGQANARNPISIFVPCHRVIGRDGSLTGYGGGLDVKRWLLDHEARLCAAAVSS